MLINSNLVASDYQSIEQCKLQCYADHVLSGVDSPENEGLNSVTDAEGALNDSVSLLESLAKRGGSDGLGEAAKQIGSRAGIFGAMWRVTTAAEVCKDACRDYETTGERR